MVDIKVDDPKCEGCGECVDICPSAVFEMTNEKSVPINPDECVECCSCVEVCPNDAITIDTC